MVLQRDLLLEYVGFVPHGASGTVVASLGGGHAFLVEFTSPVAALVTLTRDEVLPIAEQRRVLPGATWRNASGFRVDAGRMTSFLLAPDHADGGGRERFFGAWGFERAHPEPFARALLQHPMTSSQESVERDAWATRHLFDGLLASPHGPTPPIRTVWQVDEGRADARLLSAFRY